MNTIGKIIFLLCFSYNFLREWESSKIFTSEYEGLNYFEIKYFQVKFLFFVLTAKSKKLNMQTILTITAVFSPLFETVTETTGILLKILKKVSKYLSRKMKMSNTFIFSENFQKSYL